MCLHFDSGGIILRFFILHNMSVVAVCQLSNKQIIDWLIVMTHEMLVRNSSSAGSMMLVSFAPSASHAALATDHEALVSDGK